ncbi:MAG TPA: glutamate--tRNA ligase family protein, partial [Usitatibacter sp.]|nr:glutamate--tRNA ligase family protein [Usitatibacter sp.]
LAVVVDDADQEITDVVRGADLLASTPRQILLARALGYATPRYLHIPVATNAAGEKLSKQTLAPGIDSHEAGAQLAAALAFLGQPKPTVTAARSILEQAVATWDPDRIPRKPAVPA